MMRRAAILGVMILAAAAVPAGAANSQDLRQTQSVLEQGIREHPQNASLYAQLGWVYRKQGNVDAARAAFEKSAELDPSQADVLFMLGLIYEKQGQDAQAIEAFGRCKAAAAAKGNHAMAATADKHIDHLKKRR